MSKILGAVEIGTHKAKAMVGVLSPTGDLKVVAAASVKNEGVRKGEIVDYRKTASAVHAAIEEAEKAAEAKIDEVYLAQTGSHLRGTQLRGSSSTAASDNRVEYSDIERASEEAKRKEPEEGRCFVHHVRSPIVLDDRIVEDPVGMSGSSIEIGYWAIEGDNNAIKETVDIIGGYGRLGISDLFVSSIASGAIVAGADLQQSGVLVVDIGAGVTDYVLYRHGHVAATGVVCVGGDHISGDLSMGLRILEPYAEDIKIEHGKAMVDESDAKEDVWLIGNKTIGDRTVSRKSICQVINARVVELFEIIGKEIGSLLDPDMVSSGVLLTGGGSLLPGIDRVAENVLGLRAEKASFPSGIEGDLAHPGNATVLGLLHYGLKDSAVPSESNGSEGLLKKLVHLVGMN